MQTHLPGRQTEEQGSQPKAPGWAWAFILTCGAIPIVSLGGVIPAMLGAAGAAACYGLARDGVGPVHRRVLWCSLVTLGAWGGFGTLVWVVLSNQGDAGGQTRITRTSSGGTKTTRMRMKDGKVVFREEGGSSKRKNPSDMSEAERRAIYADAIERRTKLEDQEERIAEREAAGRSVRVLKKQLVTLEKLYESRIGFVAKHNGLTRSELDAIIEEGDDAQWRDD